MSERRVAWFSAGAASAVATKLTIGLHPVDIYRIDTGSEHPDSERFAADCEEWFGQPIHMARSEKYASVDEVIEQRRFMSGPHGALCTIELKKAVRWRIERDYDIQVFGYTADRLDSKRADRFREQNPEVRLETPLIERGLTKADCLGIINEAGITLPAMYLLGYQNNNCIGCVKGGMGYQNMIRVDFPETFARRARQERELGHTILREADGAPLYLDELDPDRGDIRTDPDFECSLLCAIAADEIGTSDTGVQG